MRNARLKLAPSPKPFASVPSPPGPQTKICAAFLPGFLQQLEVEGSDIVNNRIAIDYILELTSGVTGRIVDACKAECQMRYAARLTYGNC